MRRRLGTLAAALGLLLAGCAGAGVTLVRPVTFDYYYTQRFTGSVAAYGAVPTEVYGNPFDARPERLEAAVVDAVHGAHFGQDLDFTTTPPPGHRSPFRLLVLFNPFPDARPDRLCQDPAPGDSAAPAGAGAGGRVEVLMVMCSAAYRITSTYGSRGSLTSLEDPGFRDLMKRTITVLLSPGPADVNSPDVRRRS